MPKSAAPCCSSPRYRLAGRNSTRLLWNCEGKARQASSVQYLQRFQNEGKEEKENKKGMKRKVHAIGPPGSALEQQQQQQHADHVRFEDLDTCIVSPAA